MSYFTGFILIFVFIMAVIVARIMWRGDWMPDIDDVEIRGEND